jgi:hypothetical protein
MDLSQSEAAARAGYASSWKRSRERAKRAHIAARAEARAARDRPAGLLMPGPRIEMEPDDVPAFGNVAAHHTSAPTGGPKSISLKRLNRDDCPEDARGKK